MAGLVGDGQAQNQERCACLCVCVGGGAVGIREARPSRGPQLLCPWKGAFPGWVWRAKEEQPSGSWSCLQHLSPGPEGPGVT